MTDDRTTPRLPVNDSQRRELRQLRALFAQLAGALNSNPP